MTRKKIDFKASRWLWTAVLFLTVASLAFGNGSWLPTAQAASVSWTTPAKLLAKSVYPAVAVRPADGDVFIGGSGCPGVTIADSKSNWRVTLVGANRLSCSTAHLSMAFDRASVLHVVWQDRASGGYNNIFYAKVTPDGKATAPRDISNEVGVGASVLPDVATSLLPNSDGAIYLSFELTKYNSNGDATGADVAVVKSTNEGQTWGGVSKLGSAVYPAVSSPHVAIDTNNNPHFIWNDGKNVQVRDYNGGWANPVQIDNLGTPGNRAFWPVIVASPNGDLVAAWQEDLGGGNLVGKATISYARFDHSSHSWQPEIRNISQNQPSSTYHFYPALAVGSEGNVWLAWSDTTNNATGMGYVYSTDGGRTFSTPALIGGLNYVRSAFTAIASGNNQIYLAAQLDDGSGFSNYLTSTASGFASSNPTPPPSSNPPTTSASCTVPSWASGATAPTVTSALPAATSPFYSVWARYDFYATGNRSYVWGSQSFAAGQEPYLGSSNVSGATSNFRQVLYWDKSRMEITHADQNSTSAGYVTNGLLAKELITGQMQLGDTTYIGCSPANIPVAGDPDDTHGPRYSSFTGHLSDSAAAVGAPIIQTISVDGVVATNPALAGVYNVTGGYYEPTTKHTIASVFWNFLNQSNQKIWTGPNTSSQGKLFDPYWYATGLPITEPYWAQVKVGGQVKDVLIQVFERRVLTYTPSNPDPFKVEWGNIGRHYYEWRYGKSL